MTNVETENVVNNIGHNWHKNLIDMYTTYTSTIYVVYTIVGS